MKININDYIDTNIIVANIKPVKKRYFGYKVAQFDKEGKFLNCFNSLKAAAEYYSNILNKSKRSIYYSIIKACNINTNINTAYGYQWRYVHNSGEIIYNKNDKR